jgi:hypothetical protein
MAERTVDNVEPSPKASRTDMEGRKVKGRGSLHYRPNIEYDEDEPPSKSEVSRPARFYGGGYRRREEESRAARHDPEEAKVEN